jgi:hypothetical protein
MRRASFTTVVSTKMASNFQLQKPYAISKLPSPTTQAQGTPRYWAAEVYGQQPGSKKRKRTELSVGIDHDAVNLYNVRGILHVFRRKPR